MQISDVEKYFEPLSGLRQERLTRLRNKILALASGIDESMKYKMPTYEINGKWVAMANQKQYVAVYFCCADLVAPIRKAHPELSIGVGCVRVKDSQSVPEDLLIQSVARALAVT